MEETALFVARRKGFSEEACINCSIDRYCACKGANEIFDIEGVMRQKLVDLGGGIKISEPVKVERGLVAAGNFYVSLSHEGILAIYSGNKHLLQLTDLNTNKQVEMEVSNPSLLGFYDDKALLLTTEKPLRESTVERVFGDPNESIFERIEGSVDAAACTDVSLLNERRTLYYSTEDKKLFVFNVDTRTITEIDIGQKINTIASFTGIDCGAELVFQDIYDYCTYVLGGDKTATQVAKKQGFWLTTIFPSSSDPRNIEGAMFKHIYLLVKGGEEITAKRPITLDSYYSVVRVYKDVFLTFDWDTKSWVLVRILVD